MTISEVTVFGADQDITQSIHDAAEVKLQGNYLGMFSRRNAFLYPSTSIVDTIKSTFPRVLDVAISRDGWTHIRVTVNQKIPRAIVCATLPNFDNDTLTLNGDDPCYFADEHAYLFERSPGFSGHPYNVYYIPGLLSIGSTTNYIGTYATTTEEFKDLQSFYDAAQNAGIPVDGILVKDAGEYELYASTTIIYFNNAENLTEEHDNLGAFWKHMTAQARVDKKPLIFDYIDLRFGSNVFYKIIK
ncbi:MAG: hypothetical protein PHG25_03685 [Candidatus Pacebacteria bacterium]|nr:hypothetical protein [Candidatus Paceibacterota bacterium]